MGTLHFFRTVAPRPSPSTACLEAFERELDYVFWTLRRLGARPPDLEDLLQDIFAVLHRNWPTLDTSRPLRPWLFTVAFRLLRTYRRRQFRETLRDGLDLPDGGPDPEGCLQDRQSLTLLFTALERVPEPRRSVLVLHELDGVEVVEIAQRLSITTFGVYARLRKGRKELASAVRSLYMRSARP
jgi:RNA polymerase sigma-70 factor (ECF subfamily)